MYNRVKSVEREFGQRNVAKERLRAIYTSVSQSGRNRPLGGDFDGQGGEKNKGGENAHLLINH